MYMTNTTFWCVTIITLQTFCKKQQYTGVPVPILSGDSHTYIVEQSEFSPKQYANYVS